MNKDIRISGQGFSYWIDILTKKVCATKDGIYLIYCKEDASPAYHLYKLKEGDNFFDVFGPVGRGQWISEPIAFKPIPEFRLENNTWRRFEQDKKFPFMKMPYSGVYIIAYKTINSMDVKYLLSAGRKGDYFVHEHFNSDFGWFNSDFSWFDNNQDVCDIFESNFRETNPGFKLLGYYYTFAFSEEMEKQHYNLMKEDLIIHDWDKVADNKLIDNIFFNF